MAKFIINKGQGERRLERIVDADKYGGDENFVHFTKNGTRVFSMGAQYVMTVELSDE